MHATAVDDEIVADQLMRGDGFCIRVHGLLTDLDAAGAEVIERAILNTITLAAGAEVDCICADMIDGAGIEEAISRTVRLNRAVQRDFSLRRAVPFLRHG